MVIGIAEFTCESTLLAPLELHKIVLALEVVLVFVETDLRTGLVGAHTTLLTVMSCGNWKELVLVQMRLVLSWNG